MGAAPEIGRSPSPAPDSELPEIGNELMLPSHASPMPETPPPKTIGDNKESTYEECKTPTHVIKEWLPFYEEELKPKQGSEFANLEELELQRHGQLQSDNETSSSKPQLKTTKDLERHGKGLRELPSYYILNRWTKMPSRGDPDKLILVGKRIQNVVKELKELDGGTSDSKISELESFIGSSVPERIDILPPKQCHTKGSGKRLKGGKEKSMEQQQKRQRFCKACRQQGYHDSRNCPSKLSS